jgi:hypothetical protein
MWIWPALMVHAQTHREALPRRPADAADELPLRHDELLAQQPALGDEGCPSAQQIRGEAGYQANDIDRAPFLA